MEKYILGQKFFEQHVTGNILSNHMLGTLGWVEGTKNKFQL